MVWIIYYVKLYLVTEPLKRIGSADRTSGAIEPLKRPRRFAASARYVPGAGGNGLRGHVSSKPASANTRWKSR